MAFRKKILPKTQIDNTLGCADRIIILVEIVPLGLNTRGCKASGNSLQLDDYIFKQDWAFVKILLIPLSKTNTLGKMHISILVNKPHKWIPSEEPTSMRRPVNAGSNHFTSGRIGVGPGQTAIILLQPPYCYSRARSSDRSNIPLTREVTASIELDNMMNILEDLDQALAASQHGKMPVVALAD